jgi:hypothetical protein
MRKLIEKNKNCAPDDWEKAFDWDKKSEPPPIDYIESEDQSELDDDENKD